MPADIGLVGLGVMGQNLALNMTDHGYSVAVYNRTAPRVAEFLEGPAEGTGITGHTSLASLVDEVSTPRRILLMVKAGPPVDDVLAELAPLLSPGDVVIDGGNSHFRDTARRASELAERGLHLVGAGISGGEEGARHGPSIMPGGDAGAWPLVKQILQDIAAKVEDGTPCCDWVGEGGAGHYVKMVHNGIEYADIQLLAETYHIMGAGLGMDQDEMADVFDTWNRGRLDSYLVGITAEVLRYREDGDHLLPKILDAAAQKGTGRWTVEDGLSLGQPVTLIAAAVFARAVSALKDERTAASRILGGETSRFEGKRSLLIDDLESALYASKVVSYAQGFMLLDAASKEHGWELDPGGIALLWREGCIIRAAFLERIREAYATGTGPQNLLLAPHFSEAVAGSLSGWRNTVARSVTAGIPVPALSSALAFFDAYRAERLPANLIQGLRDYFGSHTYERIDAPRGQAFHTEWTESG